ncbi:MAG: thiamine pyrophosphate-dependent enzyme, partial [Patescibacteria group bacterium]
VLEEFNLDLPILKIGLSYPLPEEKIKKFIKKLESILVVEEIDPILENEIAKIVKGANSNLKIYGKNLLPPVGEMKPEYVLIALSKILKRQLPADLISHQKIFDKIKIAKRLPVFCPGCPHRATFWAVKQALGNLLYNQPESMSEVVFGGDIGCYLLGALPPYNLADYIVAMGAGIGISHGVSKATVGKPVVFIGDSTFFHAGIPALINLVYNKSDILLIILDNRITAMTGHQPHPGVGVTGQGEETKILKIEDIVQSCQVDKLEIINVYNLKESIIKIKEAYQTKGVSVVVAKGECRLLSVRKMARQGIRTPKFEIVEQSPDLEILKNFSCPAIRKTEKGKYYIEKNICWGCSVCSQIFPQAIKIKR